MLGLLAYVLGSVQVFVESLGTRVGALNELIASHFGEAGKWAFWVLAAAFGLLLAGKAAKLTFNFLRWVLLPSAAISVALVMLFPGFSPMKSFPVLVTVTTAVMLFRSQ